MIAIRFVAFAALASALFAQKPADIDGWDKIHWGMTIADARSVYGVHSQAEKTDDWTLLTLKPVKIAGVEMGVQAGARHGSEKITSVRLWSYFGLATSAPGAGAQDFDALRAALIQQYGLPAKEEVDHGENFRLLKTVSWKFPSTSILMTLEQSTSLPNLGNIILEYTSAAR
jgi:hypothetical protein